MTNFGKLEPEGKTPILYVAPASRPTAFVWEEFLCMKVEEDADQADAHAERMCRYIEEQRIEAAADGKYLTISIGYSTGMMRDDEEYRKLFREADEALYRAKNNGRNQAVRFK